ncbi:MAG: hypothetical protein PQ614_09715 [Rickettsiales bacterium]|nr:hypothetical protein [Rickettsiales bacterium]
MKCHDEEEKIRKVFKYLNKSMDEPMKIKSSFPELWDSMLDLYIILDE